MRELLWHVGRITSVRARDVFFARLIDEALDPEKLERERLRRHVFLARYGKQSMLQWADVEGREVRRYCDVLKEFLDEETVQTNAYAARASSGPK